MKRKNLLYRGLIVGTCIGLCVGFGIGNVYSKEEKANIATILEILEDGIENKKQEELETQTAFQQEEVEVVKEQSSDWRLRVVNGEYPLELTYEIPELAHIGNGYEIDARAYDEYVEMIQTAKAEGVYIYVVSAYRDFEKQEELFEDKIARLEAEGYPYEQSKELAGQVVAVPGTSEHHLGLAIDFVSSEYLKLDKQQEETRGFQWLEKNSWKYGFILRYPNGTTDITGIIYEPWHFRYVGKKAAKEITEQGITLEEYVGLEPKVEKIEAE